MFFFFPIRYALDEFGTARRTAVVRGFIDALTRGGMLLFAHRNYSIMIFSVTR